jgi:hypothetical protein
MCLASWSHIDWLSQFRRLRVHTGRHPRSVPYPLVRADLLAVAAQDLEGPPERMLTYCAHRQVAIWGNRIRAAALGPGREDRSTLRRLSRVNGWISSPLTGAAVLLRRLPWFLARDSDDNTSGNRRALQGEACRYVAWMAVLDAKCRRTLTLRFHGRAGPHWERRRGLVFANRFGRLH